MKENLLIFPKIFDIIYPHLHREMGKDLEAEVIILVTQDNVRLSFGDKVRYFSGREGSFYRRCRVLDPH